MICIYSTDNTNYSNNGDAVLIPISCTLTMTINGAWQLDLEHPYDAEERYKLIQEGAVIRADIKCVGEQSTIRQRFRVYTYNKGVNSVTCIAFPIAMEATFDAPIDNLVLENKTASEAVAQLQALTQKYSIETNVTGTKSTSFSNTNINSALASGDDGCFIQVWGGEVVYDNLKFNIRSRIGSDTGYKIQYGHNMTGIDYSKDDSGLSTRVHPISEDGIRLNGTGYVDSPLIDEYPIHHDRYMITPYRLVDTEEASPSRTAQETRACVSAVTSATTTLSQSSYATALGAGYQPDYIKTINADIITAVQNMALANVISTDLYKLLSDTIKNAMAWLADLTQPEWGWMGSDETGWRYGDTNGYAKDMYVRIGKTWSYFGSQGYWEEPKDDKEEWDWHQKEGEGRRYGNFNKYFAHNTFVYITMEGTLQEYWFNEEGWYEADESGESEWSWHGSGTSEDPYWFGEEGATSEDPKKYAHDTWLFIDGAYYFFDRYGYYAPNTAILDYQWDWVQDDERWWFGNAIDREFAAVYVVSQWLKINGTWYYFDEDGYVVDQDSSKSDAIAVFTTGMASLLTTVNTRKDALYTLLYALMTEWVNKKYAEGIDKPALTVTVSMADLSRTTEYANFAALETIKLGDSVEIDDTEHGIHTTGSRVIGLTYDVIRGYNSNVVIGKPQATVSSMLSQANGQAVAGGFDTSAIEAQIDALQDRVSDVRYNGRSLLQGTIAILDSIGGTSINYGTSTPTGGSDGDVYFQTDSNGNIVRIWQNHSGVWGGMTGGGLEYWIEQQRAFKREEVIDVGEAGWTCDEEYKVGWFQATINNRATKKNSNVACGGLFAHRVDENNYRYYVCMISPVYADTIYDILYYNTPIAQSFEVGGATLYYCIHTRIEGFGYSTTGNEPSVTYAEGSDTLPWLGKFDTNEEVVNYLMEVSHFRTNEINGVGLGIDDYLFWGGHTGTVGTDMPQPSDFPVNISKEGIYKGKDYRIDGESIDKVRDVKVNGVSVVSDKIANVDLSGKQDTLIAGQNITIGADGKTISAHENMAGETIPVSSEGNNNAIYMQYSTTGGETDYETIWTGSVSTSAWASPVQIGTINPSEYYRIKITGTGSGERLVSEIPVVGSGDLWHLGHEMYIFTANDCTELWLYSSTGYSNTVTKVEATTYDEGIVDSIEKVYGKIKDAWYEIATGGGGGTEVIPNPQGTATDTLNTVEIDGTIFDLPSGGGGGGLNIEVTKILDQHIASTGNFALDDSIDKYDALLIGGYNYVSSSYSNQYKTTLILKEDYYKNTSNHADHILGNMTASTSGDNPRRVIFYFPDDTHINIQTRNYASIDKIFGLKFEQGGSGATFEGLDYSNATDLTLPDNTGYTYTPSEDGVIMVTAYGNVGALAIQQDNFEAMHLAHGSDRWTTSWCFVEKGINYTLSSTSRSNSWPSGSWAKFIPLKQSSSGGSSSIDYSTTEKQIGTWIDGSALYQRTFNCGQLPRRTTKTISMEVKADNVISISGFAKSSSGITIPINDVTPGDVSGSVRAYISTSSTVSSIVIQTASNDTSVYTDSYITLQYTKPTT